MPQAPALWSGGLHCFWGDLQVLFKKITLRLNAPSTPYSKRESKLKNTAFMNRLRSRSIIGLMSFLLLLLGLPAGLRAQDSLYTITGRVLDEKSEALLGASVSLLQSDGKLKTGAITAKDGAFHLKGIAAGSYTLRVSFVGYKTRRDSSVRPTLARVRVSATKRT